MEEYKYLGCMVNDRLNCARMVEERAKAGAKALSDWIRRCRVAVGELRGETFVKLLEMLVDSVLLYAWGRSVGWLRAAGTHREDSAESGKDILGSGKAAPQSVPSV